MNLYTHNFDVFRMPNMVDILELPMIYNANKEKDYITSADSLSTLFDEVLETTSATYHDFKFYDDLHMNMYLSWENFHHYLEQHFFAETEGVSYTLNLSSLPSMATELNNTYDSLNRNLSTTDSNCLSSETHYDVDSLYFDDINNPRPKIQTTHDAEFAESIFTTAMSSTDLSALVS